MRIHIFTIAIVTSIVAFSTSCKSKLSNVKTESFEVSGNCNKCKSAIENASNENGVSVAIWDVDNKKLTLSFDSVKTNEQTLLKKVAYAGYDNQLYLAPDEAYNSLDECCKYPRTIHQQETSTESQNSTDDVQTSQDTTSTENVISEENPFGAFFNDYFNLKESFISGDKQSVTASAKVLLAECENLQAIQNQPMIKLVWSSHSGAIMNLLSEMVKAKDIEQQRMKFKELTPLITSIFEKAKPEYPVYIDHCPMFDDGKGGDWLSKDKEIRNPFYGSMMLGCGKVNGTIK